MHINMHNLSQEIKQIFKNAYITKLDMAFSMGSAIIAQASETYGQKTKTK